MSAEVKREHREAAATALMLGVSDAMFAFEFAGETCGEERLEEAARVAQAIADAEARGRDEADSWWRVRLSTALADRDLLHREVLSSQREREKQGPR